MVLYVGVDPGAKGALCILDPYGDIIFLPTPKYHISAVPLLQKLREILATKISHVALEDVHSLYGMSAKSNFTFGRNVQAVTSLLQFVPISYELVTPKVWQKAVGVPPKKERNGVDIKQIVYDMAIKQYSSAILRGPKGGLLDGRSDALMIAHYLYKKYGELYVSDNTATLCKTKDRVTKV